MKILYMQGIETMLEDLKMSEKKVVGRNVAIALGIICIILAVGLVGAVANYTSIITSKDNTISSLNSQIATKDSQISSLNSQITNLQNQVNDLNSIMNLEKSTVWVDDQTVSQPAGSYTYWTFSAGYAGYVSVWVQTSTTDNTYVRVIWSSHGVNYDHSITVGVSGTAVFPILPTSSIEIRVGNSNLFSGATETVTITYHY
jgi:cell division protein FtsL